MKYKALFFDLDGTLASFRTHSVPESAKYALAEARKRGVKVFLATGRHPMLFKMDRILDGIDFDGYLTATGQYCYNDREVFHKVFICREDKEALVSQLEDKPYPVLFQTADEIYLNMTDDRVERAHALLNYHITTFREPQVCLEQDLLSLIVYGGEEADRLPLSVMRCCKSVRWHPSFADVIPAEGGKDRGIDAVLAHYGIDLSETMAFGDAQNDLSMLRHVEVGIAMGNADDTVKRAADDVTAHVDEDGILLALRKHGIIE